MIVVADLFKVHNEHVPINASMLYMISQKHKNETIHFYAEENHCKYVRSFLANNSLSVNNISWHRTKAFVQLGEGKSFLLKRIFSEIRSLIKLSRKYKKVSDKKLFLLYLSPLSGIIFKSFLWRCGNALITLHGDLEFIKLDGSFMRNFLGRCFRFSFSMKRSTFKYLALEETIKKNLLQTGLLNATEIVAIPHPYIFMQSIPSLTYKVPFAIGYIGMASIEKNAEWLFSLAKKFEPNIIKHELEFVLIGKNENIPAAKINDLVKGGSNKEMLDRNSFEKQVQLIHFAIFFHDNKAYQFTGSGSIYDAFNFEKPIIALRTDLFESFFERAGKVGFLCNDMNEMEMVVRDVLNGKITSAIYEEMQLNMRAFKAVHTLADIGHSFFNQLKEWENYEN